MSQQGSADASNVEAIVDSLNQAYSKHGLDDYRALELKESFDEETTCRVQWGPMMRT